MTVDIITPRSPSSRLDMKISINIDVDAPDISFPSVPTDFGDYASTLDSSSVSSMFSSLTSFVALPPPATTSSATTPLMMGDAVLSEATYKGFTEMSNILDLTSFSDTSLLMSFTEAFTHLTAIGISAITTIGVVMFALSFPNDNFRVNHEPYERGDYDPQLAREYYAKHSFLVLRRGLQLFRIANKFILRWLFHQLVGRHLTKFIKVDEETKRKQEEQNAEELLEIIQKVGPTAIKVGQALSVRPDLISEVYTEKLSKLQDNVPPFDSGHAQDVLLNELGFERFQMLKNIDLDNPVASASIGQVYRGKVMLDRNNDVNGFGDDLEEVEIAVKVQRPNVLSEIALDLFLARELAPLYQKLTMNDTNMQKIADEWGRGFINELTYEQEARNTIQFNAEMVEMNMNAVCAPNVVEKLSTNRVLTTEWVKGQRLDKSDNEDVARLCGVALNAYLVMLLETGTLHCDPHPGNLLRTDDGRLCILDFGMTIQAPEDLQYALLEFIAHLTSENYDAIPQDLVNLRFLKQDKLELFLQLGVLEPMFYFFKQAANGGGTSKIRDRIMEEYQQKYPGADENEIKEHMRQEIADNTELLVQKASSVTGITMKIEDLQRENSDAFVIPEWFLYVSRAFLTLEGISVKADPEFSIIKSCFPYIAKRLIGDDSPRSQAALKKMVYGADEEINPAKISELADGFTTYTTTTKIVSQGGSASKDQASSSDLTTEAAIALAKDSADILLHPTGNLVQNIILKESATAVHANMKDLMREILIDNPQRLRSTLPFGFLIPKFPAEQVALFLQKSQREEQIQTLLTKFPSIKPPTPGELGNAIRSLDTNDPLATLIDGMSAEEVAAIWKALRENAPTYAPRALKLGEKFASSVFEKVSDDIDSVIEATETTSSSSSLPDTIIRNSAKGVSAVAKAAARASSQQSANREE